jgi:uncharacterized protein YbjT (DUF2867 family)
MKNNLILVTGATGYIASRLIPRLLDSGYTVRALARNPLRLKGRSWIHQVEVLQGDVMNPSTLASALEDVRTAYYLIHNMSSGHGYTERELDGARNFANAAETAGIEHIIYLGGLADTEQNIGSHMRSRIETGAVLRQCRVPVTEFRAGVVAGSGSISFEMIRFMTELLPIILGTAWMNNMTQPIAIQNVIDYLFAALTNPNGRGGVFEIGGPEITTYGDLMLRYARARGLKRRMFLLPGIPISLMAFGVGLMTPVPYPIAYALIGGLSTDSVVKYPEVLQTFPEVKLIDFDSATQRALKITHPDHIERVWDDGRPGIMSLKHEGCFILHKTSAFPKEHRDNVSGGLSSHEMSYRGPKSKRDGTREHFSNSFGELWIEARTEQEHLIQTLFFSPRGLPGFLCWYLLYPFHLLRFRGLIRRVVKQS